MTDLTPTRRDLMVGATAVGLAAAGPALAQSPGAPAPGARGIRVNAVAPGPVWTPLQVAGGQLPGELGKFGQDTPVGRAGQPAELFVALAEPGNSFTTGSVFGANGGTGALRSGRTPPPTSVRR